MAERSSGNLVVPLRDIDPDEAVVAVEQGRAGRRCDADELPTRLRIGRPCGQRVPVAHPRKGTRIPPAWTPCGFRRSAVETRTGPRRSREPGVAVVPDGSVVSRTRNESTFVRCVIAKGVTSRYRIGSWTVAGGLRHRGEQHEHGRRCRRRHGGSSSPGRATRAAPRPGRRADRLRLGSRVGKSAARVIGSVLADRLSRVLELRPNCECCDLDLPPESSAAMICTFECTWCARCVEACLGGVCPNCGGDLQPRPIRPVAHLTTHPASGRRVLHDGLHRQ